MRKPIHQLYAILLATALLGACSDSDSDDLVIEPLPEMVTAYACDGNVNDSVGTAHGTPSGGFAYTADRFGNANSACLFDGVDSKFTVSSDIGSAGGTGLSVSFWAITSAINTNSTVIYAGGNKFEIWPGMNFTMSSGPTNTVYSTLTVDIWTHFVATYHSDSQAMKIYMDGVLIDEDVKGSSTGGLNINLLEVGQTSNFFKNEFWSGALDDLQLYDFDLTADQVSTIYTAQS
jgi:hypothetical protein